ncbi:phage shock envelope stress response protein PspM [Planosporangium sp. 12N6]|uniref:phage shock envelope stress response protein PspM n=1 Tax=Planosporangium spinosum TaxID=3402278 RepID=UPI003CF14C42
MRAAADPRARHFRQLHRLRRSARGWTVRAGLFTGAAAVLLPYHGLGLPDALWAAAAGGSLAMAGLRWAEVRSFAALPAPPPPDPALAAERTRRGLESLVRRLPAGESVLDEVRRQRDRVRLRGTAVAPAWQRLDRAAAVLAGLSGRLDGPAEPAVQEAAVAERALRDLAERAAGVERAARLAPGEALTRAHAELVAQFEEGVAAYEQLVGAAAGYVAEDGRPVGENVAAGRLREATDLLRGIAAGLSELRAYS